MTLLDLIFDIERSIEESTKIYKYWSVDEDGMFMYMNFRKQIDNIIDFDSLYEDELVPFIRNSFDYQLPLFVPFEELKFLTEIEIEFNTEVWFDSFYRNPLICVRGICDKQCVANNFDGYCFRSLPCTGGRPDWNVWSSKDPNFYDLLNDVIGFIRACPHTDTLVVFFNFTPYPEEPELNFNYCFGLHIVNNKITVLSSDETKEMYSIYNSKYPTQDREIERAISEPNKDFYFKF